MIQLAKRRCPSSGKLNLSWQWEVGHSSYWCVTPLDTHPQPGGKPIPDKEVLMAGFSLQLLALFNEEWAGAAEPPGWSEHV